MVRAVRDVVGYIDVKGTQSPRHPDVLPPLPIQFLVCGRRRIADDCGVGRMAEAQVPTSGGADLKAGAPFSVEEVCLCGFVYLTNFDSQGSRNLSGPSPVGPKGAHQEAYAHNIVAGRHVQGL